MHFCRGVEDGKLLAGFFAVRKVGRAQRPRQPQFLKQPDTAFPFRQGCVTLAARSQREQFGDQLLVHAAVLTHVERRQMKAENDRGTVQSAQPPARHPLRTVGRQRIGQHRQVLCEFDAIPVGRRLGDRATIGHVMVEQPRGRGKPRVDAGQRTPIRLVAAMFRGVRRLLRQLLELGRGFDHAHGLGQFAA